MAQSRNLGAIVYWIDKSHSVRSEIIHPYQLKGSATYESEGMHISDYAEIMEVVLLERAGGFFEEKTMERLRLKADELRKNQEKA